MASRYESQEGMEGMKSRLEWIATLVIVLCAVATTELLAHRELSTKGSREQFKNAYIKDWRSNLSVGTTLGSAQAKVQVVEFADFECPFCGSLHPRLKRLRGRYPHDVALVFVHVPIDGHRFSMSAARAAECAGDQGQFETMHDKLFEDQQELGRKPWSSFAAEARVPDLSKFQACVDSGVVTPKIAQGQELAQKLSVHGTPTVMVNGWLLSKAPNDADFDAIVAAILSGKEVASAIGPTWICRARR